MANETLSIKLHELDEKVSRVYSRILMLESADHASICREKKALTAECEKSELAIRRTMQESKAQIVGEFQESYEVLESVIRETKEKLALAGSSPLPSRADRSGSAKTDAVSDHGPSSAEGGTTQNIGGLSSAPADDPPMLSALTQNDLSHLSTDELIDLTERKFLLAEYALDFAMLAADHALLFSLDALDVQMTAEEALDESFDRKAI